MGSDTETESLVSRSLGGRLRGMSFFSRKEEKTWTGWPARESSPGCTPFNRTPIYTHALCVFNAIALQVPGCCLPLNRLAPPWAFAAVAHAVLHFSVAFSYSYMHAEQSPDPRQSEAPSQQPVPCSNEYAAAEEPTAAEGTPYAEPSAAVPASGEALPGTAAELLGPVL